MDEIDALMKQGLADGVFPGAVLLAARSEAVPYGRAYGLADVFSGRPMTMDTVFDLASLTKPLATTLAVMHLIQHQKIALEQPIAELLPAFRGSDKAAVRIDQLLAHVSGLPDYRPYYADLTPYPASERSRRLAALLRAEPLVAPPGKQTLYSDLGFMLLALVIEAQTECRLDVYVDNHIYRPLGIRDLFFIDIHQPKPARSYAATEYCKWRRHLVDGAVHDENAYALGGISGHAGLFGTARGVCELLINLLKAFHGADEMFDPALTRGFLSRYPGHERALGFDMPSAAGSSTGGCFNRDAAFGHLGFTGTSFWMAVDRSIIIILLTNRIHPSRENEAIKAFRPRLHDAVMTRI